MMGTCVSISRRVVFTFVDCGCSSVQNDWQKTACTAKLKTVPRF